MLPALCRKRYRKRVAAVSLTRAYVRAHIELCSGCLPSVMPGMATSVMPGMARWMPGGGESALGTQRKTRVPWALR